MILSLIMVYHSKKILTIASKRKTKNQKNTRTKSKEQMLSYTEYPSNPVLPSTRLKWLKTLTIEVWSKISEIKFSGLKITNYPLRACLPKDVSWRMKTNRDDRNSKSSTLMTNSGILLVRWLKNKIRLLKNSKKLSRSVKAIWETKMNNSSSEIIKATN